MMKPAPKANITTLVICTDHCRLETLNSIKWLQDIPAPILNFIVEFAEDIGTLYDECEICQQKVYVLNQEMRQMKEYFTWTVVDNELYICEECAPHINFDDGELQPCLDCGTGVFTELKCWCNWCNRGAVHRSCWDYNHSHRHEVHRHDSKAELGSPKCHQCLLGHGTTSPPCGSPGKKACSDCRRRTQLKQKKSETANQKLRWEIPKRTTPVTPPTKDVNRCVVL